MSYFKSGYFNPQYFNTYWQEVLEAELARLDVNAAATASFGGLGGLPDEVPTQPDQTIGGALGKRRPQTNPLRPWEAFEPTIVWAKATVTGTAHVTADALHDDPIVLAQERQAELQAIDEDDQIVLSFVTAFLSEANNGCEINGTIS